MRCARKAATVPNLRQGCHDELKERLKKTLVKLNPKSTLKPFKFELKALSWSLVATLAVVLGCLGALLTPNPLNPNPSNPRND